MSYLIAILILAALFHFIYESIFAPSFRTGIRYRLFALRDEVRHLKITCAGALSDKHFDYLQDSINSLLSVVNFFDFAVLVKIDQAIKADPELRERAKARTEILDDCGLPQTRAIRVESVKLAIQALIVNSGGWFVLIIPIAAIIACFSGVQLLIRSTVSLSERDLESVVPSADGLVQKAQKAR